MRKIIPAGLLLLFMLLLPAQADVHIKLGQPFSLGVGERATYPNLVFFYAGLAAHDDAEKPGIFSLGLYTAGTQGYTNTYHSFRARMKNTAFVLYSPYAYPAKKFVFRMERVDENSITLILESE